MLARRWTYVRASCKSSERGVLTVCLVSGILPRIHGIVLEKSWVGAP